MPMKNYISCQDLSYLHEFFIYFPTSIDENLLKSIAKAYSGEPKNNTDYFLSVDFTRLAGLVPTISQQACVTEPPIVGKSEVKNNFTPFTFATICSLYIHVHT